MNAKDKSKKYKFPCQSLRVPLHTLRSKINTLPRENKKTSINAKRIIQKYKFTCVLYIYSLHTLRLKINTFKEQKDFTINSKDNSTSFLADLCVYPLHTLRLK